MNLIAISGKRRSGKTTLGRILATKFGYHPISLAEPLKNMCSLHFGLSYDQTDGVFKEQPTQYKDYSSDYSPRYLTPREIMIKTGQFYRSIDPDFWTKKLFKQIQEVSQAQMQTFVVTDVRFKNEMEWMKRHAAICVRLERDQQLTGTSINDPSETELDDYYKWDIAVPQEENVNMTDLDKVAERINGYLLARAG